MGAVGALLAASVPAAAWLLGRLPDRADHVTAATAEPEPAQVGPAPGPLEPRWSFDVPAADASGGPLGRVTFDIEGGRLLVLSRAGLEARSLRSGRPWWHYRRPGWTLAAWAATAGTAIAYFDRADGGTGHLMIAFDAGTGRELWHDSEARPADLSWQTLRWPAAGGVVAVSQGSRLVGRRAAGGGIAWSLALPAGCRPAPGGAPNPGGGDAGTLALALACGAKGVRVLGLDAGSGRRLWERSLPGSLLRVTVSTAGDITSLGSLAPSGLTVLGRYGRVLLSDPAAICDPECEAVSTPAAVLVHPVTLDFATAALAPGTGAVLWRRQVPSGVAARAGALVYLFSRGELGVAALSVVDPAGGEWHTVPLPFTFDYLGLASPDPWLGVAGGLAIAAYPSPASGRGGGVHVVALGGAAAATGAGPAELGGVPAAEWPDACALLAPADLVRAAPGARFAPASPLPGEFGGVRLPRPVGCGYDSSRFYVSASVDWVSAGTEAAHRLFLSARTAAGGRPLAGLGDEAFESAGATVVRVGRVELTVSAFPADQEAADMLARAAVARLAGRGAAA